jgi:glycosyltransferase involved in cell wall biosynthesis
VAELVDKINPSVAHVHLGVTSPFAWGALRALNDMNVPTVATVHSMWGPVARAGYSAASHIAPWKRAGSRVVWSAVSEEAASRVKQSLHVTVHQMPNGIDLASWRCEPSLSDSTRLISVLRMAPRKRAIPLLRIIESIQQRTTESTAVVVGDGPLLKSAKSLAARRGLNIDFKGRLKPAQIREEFAQSDIFIQASVHESFGIAALEARTAGLVVLARRGTGTESFIVNGVNGYLTNSDSHMAATAIHLSHHPDEIRSIKDFNRENPPQFDWQSVVSISRELYASARHRPVTR